MKTLLPARSQDSLANMSNKSDSFLFGIEAEFLLVDKNDFQPLSHKDLNFDKLAELLNSIPSADFGQSGFNIKPLHSRATPYLVEGYYLTDSDMNPVSLLPKGIEIRTPSRNSIKQSLHDLSELYKRLQSRLLEDGWQAAVISHHPTEGKFDAPANYRRHDYWQWALTAATTFGPDINISLPAELSSRIELPALAAKLNYYLPSVIAMTLASPIAEGKVWQVRGVTGKSIRTYRRSIWAPLFYVHEKPSLRFEFKGFEMSRCLDDYNVFFLLSMALLLDETLNETAADEARIYDLGQIAVFGLGLSPTREIASRVMESAEKIASRFALSRQGMDEFWNRLESRKLPADDILAVFQETESVPATLSRLLGLYSNTPLSTVT